MLLSLSPLYQEVAERMLSENDAPSLSGNPLITAYRVYSCSVSLLSATVLTLMVKHMACDIAPAI